MEYLEKVVNSFVKQVKNKYGYDCDVQKERDKIIIEIKLKGDKIKSKSRKAKIDEISIYRIAVGNAEGEKAFDKIENDFMILPAVINNNRKVVEDFIRRIKKLVSELRKRKVKVESIYIGSEGYEWYEIKDMQPILESKIIYYAIIRCIYRKNVFEIRLETDGNEFRTHIYIIRENKKHKLREVDEFLEIPEIEETIKEHYLIP